MAESVGILPCIAELVTKKALDGTTKVHVMTDDRVDDGYASDTEDTNSSRLDDIQESAAVSRNITPHKGLTQPMATYHDARGANEGTDGSMHGTYMSDAVLRGSNYGQAVPGSDFPDDVARYGEISGMSAGPPLNSSSSMGLSEIHYMQAQDPNRRPSMADAHTDFTTPTTPGGYGSWTNTSASGNTAVYPMAGPGYQSNTLVPVGQPGVTMTQAQSYSMMYDGMPRGHDLGSTNMLRGTLAHGSTSGPSGYQDYGHQGTRLMSGSGIKQEGLHRNISHLR